MIRGPKPNNNFSFSMAAIKIRKEDALKLP